MSTKIRNTFRNVSRDGRVGKKDVQEMLEKALDGKGVTKNEAATLRKIRDENSSKFTKAGLAAFDRFLGKMSRSWSTTKKVHLPHMDKDDLKELIQQDPRFAIYTGSSGGAGKSGGTTAPSNPPVSSGGKSGGTTTPSNPPPVSGGGKSGGTTAPDPTPPPVSGGGKSGGTSAPPSPPPVSGGGKSGGSTGGGGWSPPPPVSGSGK